MATHNKTLRCGRGAHLRVHLHVQPCLSFCANKVKIVLVLITINTDNLAMRMKGYSNTTPSSYRTVLELSFQETNRRAVQQPNPNNNWIPVIPMTTHFPGLNATIRLTILYVKRKNQFKNNSLKNKKNFLQLKEYTFTGEYPFVVRLINT